MKSAIATPKKRPGGGASSLHARQGNHSVGAEELLGPFSEPLVTRIRVDLGLADPKYCDVRQHRSFLGLGAGARPWIVHTNHNMLERCIRLSRGFMMYKPLRARDLLIG